MKILVTNAKDCFWHVPMFALLQSSKHLPPFKIQIVQLVQTHYIVCGSSSSTPYSWFITWKQHRRWKLLLYCTTNSTEHILVWGTNFVLLSGSLCLTAMRTIWWSSRAVIQMNVSAVLCIFGFKCNYVYCPLSTVFWDSPLNAGNSVLQVFADSGWWQLVFVFFLLILKKHRCWKTIVLPVILWLLLNQLQHDLNG